MHACGHKRQDSDVEALMLLTHHSFEDSFLNPNQAKDAHDSLLTGVL